MSSRTYLSIGDVLTLLREEFPDVTISKIRFLESQGLVNPERSPSGYRKFFEHDVERLRWVLRQQREHFLPLKVIRDRLADGDLEEGADLVNGKSGDLHAAARVPRAEEQPTKADEEAMARILADASRRTANLPEAAQGRRGLQVVPDHAPSAASAAGAGGADGPGGAGSGRRRRLGEACRGGRRRGTGRASRPGTWSPARPMPTHHARAVQVQARRRLPRRRRGAPGAKQGQTDRAAAAAGSGTRARGRRRRPRRDDRHGDRGQPDRRRAVRRLRPFGRRVVRARVVRPD